MIKIDLLGFVVIMHSDLYEQYFQSRGLTVSASDLLLTLVHCVSKLLRKMS